VPYTDAPHPRAPGLTWFCVWQADTVLSLAHTDLAALRELIESCPGLRAGHILLPTDAHDPYYPSATGSPSLVLQLDFDDLALLEANLTAEGHLAPLADNTFVASLAGARCEQQGMLARAYPVPDPTIRTPDGSCLSYWVEYAGPADDANAWHVYYNRHHPGLLAGFPGLRAIEIYTPAVVVCGLDIPERPCLQRNKTVFDDAQAMNQAMQSPVRQQLREDFHRLPAFQGPAWHFPFTTVTCTPRG
jgi:hypothetical protein